MATLAVTGATGGLGGRVARRLADRGVAMRRALDGADTLLLVSASEALDRVRLHTGAVDAAVAAGVQRIVYVSFLACSADATFTFARDHWHTEEHVRGSGVRHTFLRDSLYLDYFPIFAGGDGVIRGPAGDGRVAAVARDDIADVVVAVLLGDGHDGRTYDLTGPEAFTMHQAAEALSRASGRTVTYHAETLDEAYASRAGYGAPHWEVTGWVTTYAAIAAGELDVVSDAVATIAGHPPMDLAEFLRRNPATYRHLVQA
ncbi:MAG TPA: NmrA family NAD(P)-binding protein [Actinomycetota bacterium]|nr:NmrA family NAD(P)-binding protein [Actinomycetota bacterium]